MKCKNCGMEIPDHSSFCIYCGALIGDDQPESADQNKSAADTTDQSTAAPEENLEAEKMENRHPESWEEYIDNQETDGVFDDSHKKEPQSGHPAAENYVRANRSAHYENAERDAQSGRNAGNGRAYGNAGGNARTDGNPDADRSVNAGQKQSAGRLFEGDWDEPESRMESRSRAAAASGLVLVNRFRAMEPRKRIITIIVIICVLIAGIIACVRAYDYFSRQRIDILSTVTIPQKSIEGFNGDAKITGGAKFTVKNPKTMGSLDSSGYYSEFKNEAEWSDFKDSLYVTIDKKKNLKNGDTIKMTLNTHYSEEAVKQVEDDFHVRFVGIGKTKKEKITSIPRRYKNGKQAEKDGGSFAEDARTNMERFFQEKKYFGYQYYANPKLVSTYFAKNKEKDAVDFLVLIYKAKERDSDLDDPVYLRVLVGPFNTSVSDTSYSKLSVDDEDFVIDAKSESQDPVDSHMNAYVMKFDSEKDVLHSLHNGDELSYQYTLYKMPNDIY